MFKGLTISSTRPPFPDDSPEEICFSYRKAGRHLGERVFFNPMDLFNPFAPTDIEREYKIGDDMAYAKIAFGE